MATKWVNNATGSDATGDGSVGNPYASMAKAFTVVSNGDIIKVLPGTGQYNEGEIYANQYAQWIKLVGVGNVVLNGIGYDYSFRHSRTFGGEKFLIENMIITGYETYMTYLDHDSQGQIWFSNCTVYQKGSKYDQIPIANLGHVRARNTTFFGIKPGGYQFEMRNCIYITQDTYWGQFGPTPTNCDFNAVSISSSVRGSNGWDPATYPPPFMSDSTTAPDLRYDTTATHYNKYHHTDGELGQCVGHAGIPVINHYPKSEFNVHNFDDNTIWGAWVNDSRWYDSTAPGVDGPSDAGPALIDTDNIQVDTATVNDARSARVISDVWDMGQAIKLKRAQIVKSVEESGQIDTDGTSPYQIEVRADAASFTKTDAPATTDLDWTAFTYNDGSVSVDESYRYWQVRITIRLDATS